MAFQSAVTDENEVTFAANAQLVSTTDLQGDITYANEVFCSVAGYRQEEMLGRHHSIVRHPDMPKAAFRELWAHIQAGHSWRGAVKNRCKDGRHYYWVDAYVTPIREQGKITGYQSVRTQLAAEHRARAEHLYRQLLEQEQSGKTAPKLPGHTLKQYKPWVSGGVLSALLLTAFVLGGGQQLIWALLPLIWLAVSQHEYLFGTRHYLQRLSQDYDSVSRQVFSGDAPHKHC